MSLIAPVNARVSQLFGANPNSIQPNGHTGKDYAVALNTPIKASADGTVVWADWATKLSASNKWWIAPAYAGICVVIDHGNGFLTLYAHLNSTPLNIGNRVSQGQQIGLSGSTGLSTGPHLHFEVLGWPLQPYNGFYGRLNPDKYLTTIAPAASLAANQRKVGADNVNMRSEPKSSAKILRVINGGTTETFTGWIDGETVKGINIWYKDAQGYAWSGGFTSQATTGLTNLNPKPPVVTVNLAQRTAGTDNVNMRSQPNTTSPVVRVISGKSNEIFTGYVTGETVKGINIWYKDAKGYAWAGGFTSQSTTGLANVTPKPAPAPTPAPTPAPVPVPAPEPVRETYTFKADFDFVEVQPAAIDHFMPGNFPDKPAKVVIHQFGTLGVDTIGSTINTFTNPNSGRQVSAHFAVSGKRIVQFVSLKDRAYHAGSVGNDYVGIETDPAQDADTIASTKKLLAALKAKYGYELPKTLHKDVPGNSTNCGASITLSKYDLAPVVVTPTPTPVPTPPPAPTPAPVVDEEAVIDEFLAYLKDQYFKTK